MTIAVLANCQGFAIKKILQENFQNIKFLDIPLIFTILNNEDAKEKIFSELHKADYILMQPLKERFGRLSLENVKNTFKIKVISFPVLYFRFYHPEIIYLRNKDKSSIKSFMIDYHDINIINGYLNNKSSTELYQDRQSLYTKNNKNFYDKIWEQSIDSLHKNEEDCDIIISDYIKEQGKTNKLFHVVNHPSNKILDIVVQRIINKITQTINYKSLKMELLSNVVIPLSPSIKLYMSEKNDVIIKDEDHFEIRNNQYDYLEMIEIYYTFYDSIDKDILKWNLYNTDDTIVKYIINNSES